MNKVKRFELRLDKYTQEKLAEIAKETKHSQAAIIRGLIQQAAAAPNTERLQTTR